MTEQPATADMLPTSRKPGTLMCGWCLTGHHHQCRRNGCTCTKEHP
jgi:hypothetical protein